MNIYLLLKELNFLFLFTGETPKMTILHQGLAEEVPSSHKGSEFRYAVVRQFSRGDERIMEDIQVPDSLGKEAFLVGVFTSRGTLKAIEC